ncbi:MAG: hypothetical protein AABZ13_06020 [Planctomycetota bacterium]
MKNIYFSPQFYVQGLIVTDHHNGIGSKSRMQGDKENKGVLELTVVRRTSSYPSTL